MKRRVLVKGKGNLTHAMEGKQGKTNTENIMGNRKGMSLCHQVTPVSKLNWQNSINQDLYKISVEKSKLVHTI